MYVKTHYFLFCLLTKLIETKVDVSVTIKNTEYIGSSKLVLDRNVIVFQGIPYAEPPIGELRFKKPKPWLKNGVIFANQWPDMCPQNTKYNQSEDCLKLNIWTPVGSQNDNYIDEGALKAVMVWFHGGGFVMGFGHNGEVLAVKGDVVVVTVNYRLGGFGFLYSGSEDAPGNVGLWDQILALEWVNDNIRYFGGNPDQITIFGESAGSRSISLHLLNSHSTNLFRNAIMMSGSVLSPLSNPDPQFILNYNKKLANYLGCNGNELSNDVMKCLRHIPFEDIVKAQNSEQMKEYYFGIIPNLVYDNSLMPSKPIDILRNGIHKSKINVLVSVTDEEGSWILNKYDSIKYSRNNPKNFDKEQAIHELKNILKQIDIINRIESESIAKYYFELLKDNNEYDLLRRTIAVALGDFFITCPTLSFADIIYRNNPNNNNVYSFYWTSKLGDFCGSWHGACHESDIRPAFGYPFRKDGTELEKNVSERYIDIITHFAKYDKPPKLNNIVWPKYYMIGNNSLTPYYNFMTDPESHHNYGIGLKNNECEKIWNQIIAN